MENNTEILMRRLVRHVAETHIRGLRGKEQRQKAIQEAFHRCMVERIQPILQKRKKQIAFEMFPRAQKDEDLKSFVGAVGSTVGHAAAHQVAAAIGVKTSTVMNLGRAALAKSKSKSTTQLVPSKRPTSKKKK